MFLIINIVFILLVFRVLFNAKVLRRLMDYHWGFLLKFQHVFFLLIFLIITFFTENYFLDVPELIWSVLSVIIFNVGIYSLVYFYLVPEFYLSNKYPEFILYALISFLVSSLFRILLQPTVFHMNFTENLSNTKFLYNVYTAQGIVILVASFLGITKDKFLIEEDFKDLGEEKDQLYLDLLKSKMNPHFLLNTLNNIYSKSFQPSENTSESILQLSKLLQYVIYDTSKEKISMAQEFSSIKSLAGLYQLKYNNVLNISFDIQDQETLELIDIPPSVCLTLFENALKHSAVGIEPESYINVTYKIKGQEFLFEIRNSVSKKKNLVGNMNDSGLGNEAVINILEKNYAGKYTFISEPAENDYQTILKIKL
ncbi:sensor histidine kinase [Chryseobacterium lathyri]|uniref:sensor histidine kinase n=1 Tax=Chryseobacterium lathyri TaxID=395933 RepID=UPI00278B0763|nr:sensor histidine kinase [Chryseobacterium lathyri]MDQ0067857.1 sensor histidine kinase YesM [Chryseobacterium lathyri]